MYISSDARVLTTGSPRSLTLVPFMQRSFRGGGIKAKPKVCSEESFENSGRIFYRTATDEFRTGHCEVW